MAIDWLIQRMAQWRNFPALIRSNRMTSYGELLDLTELWQRRLTDQGFVAGQIVALRGDYTPQACSLLLALIHLGMIIVPITETSEVHEKEFLDIAEVEKIISFDGTDGWSFVTYPIVVSNPLILKLRASGDSGLVLFSSGSTGKSKAVLHNFSSLLEKFRVEHRRMSTITFLLLDHMGGINTLLYALSNGGKVVSVRDRNPMTVCQVIERYQVELLPTSPTFLNLLLISGAYKEYDLSSLKLITYGTEVMPMATLQRVSELFPQVRLKQTYGLSEVGVLHSHSRDSNSLWLKVGGDGFETKVVDGILWVRAKSAMLGYLNAPSPFDSDGWMNTGDMVEVDDDYIRILGRKSDIINVGGQKVYPAEVENVLLQMPKVSDAVVYQDNNSLLNTVAARIQLVTPEPLDVLKKRMRIFCRDKLASYKIPVRVEIVDRDLFSARYKKTRI